MSILRRYTSAIAGWSELVSNSEEGPDQITGGCKGWKQLICMPDGSNPRWSTDHSETRREVLTLAGFSGFIQEERWARIRFTVMLS